MIREQADIMDLMQYELVYLIDESIETKKREISKLENKKNRVIEIFKKIGAQEKEIETEHENEH